MASTFADFQERRAPLQRILYPFQRFAHTESAGGIVLIACTAIALFLANSPWADAYHHFWETPLSVGLGPHGISYSLHHWINDGLMAVFFFLVGLEIKREMLIGQLSSMKRAALPIAAAFGGMIVPALIYTLVNPGGEAARGWGIPMATDIAFALGALALLGPRAPLALKVFLAALAIVDDIGAVLVIALFYTAEISWGALGMAVAFLGAMMALNRLDARSPLVYTVFAVGLWLAFLQSGIHATIAGVLAAMTIPARTRIDTAQFLERGRELMRKFDDAGIEGREVRTNHDQQAVIQAIETTCEQAQAPLQRIEHKLHDWVVFAIMPLFALANAGVHLSGDLGVLTHPVTIGVVLGLVIGKPLGITLFSWLAVRLGVAAKPADVSWRAIHGVSWLGGIGFTMSLFITHLAFLESPLEERGKFGILLASALAGMVGWVLIRSTAMPAPPPE